MKYTKFESAEYRRGRRRAARQGLDLALLDMAVELLQEGDAIVIGSGVRFSVMRPRVRNHRRRAAAKELVEA